MPFRRPLLGSPDRHFRRCNDLYLKDQYPMKLRNLLIAAVGLAITASRVGGAKDAIAPGVNGCLFDPLNRAELKICLRGFIADHSLALKLGEAARKTAVEKYSMARVTDDLIGIYGES